MTFPRACAICGSTVATVTYRGPVRRGRFGEFVDGEVHRCAGCGVDSLGTAGMLDVDAYASSAYRELVGERSESSNFFDLHDSEQFAKIPLLRGVLKRGTIVLDVGCAAGSFLDFISGIAARTIAVEPATAYHASLRERGHEVFADLQSAGASVGANVDLAVSFSVIEHVEDPVGLLKGIRQLVKPGGSVLLSTPNRRDLLVQCGPDAYRSFFYRLVHRFYFDAASLGEVLTRASFAIETVRYHHRFGFANFVGWLRDGKPTADTGQVPLPAEFDDRWRLELQETGVADYLYIVARAC